MSLLELCDVNVSDVYAGPGEHGTASLLVSFHDIVLLRD